MKNKYLAILTRILFVFILLVVIAELFVRLAITMPVQTEPDTELGWRYRPHATILHTREGRATNRMNALGFNDREIDNDRTKTRVLAFGDSITMALQVSREDNFTSIAERRKTCLDVFNAGRSGFSPLYYPAVLDRLDGLYEPDIAVLVATSGDIAEIRDSNYEVIRDPESNAIKDIQFITPAINDLRVSLDPLLSRSSLATHLMYRFKEILLNKSGGDAVPRLKEHSVAEGDKTDYGIISDVLLYILQKIGEKVPVAVLYIPALEYGYDHSAVASEQSVSAGRLLEEISNIAGVPYLSAELYLRLSYQKTGQPPVGFPNNNIRSGHLNREGHRAVATALLKLLDVHCMADNRTSNEQPDS